MVDLYLRCNGGGFCTGAHRLCICLNRHVILGLDLGTSARSASGGVRLSLESPDFLKVRICPFQLDKSLVAPYILAGLIGVPLGTYLLDIIQAQTFKLILGIFLILWCPLMLLNPQIRFIQNSGKYADSSIGFLGGVLGGVGGFCGSLPSAWVMLKNLPKEQQRSILRHFNFAIQLFTLLTYLLRGNLNLQHLPYMGILLLSVSLPAMLGAQLFYKISKRQFKHTVLGLLFSSGCFLCISYRFL